MSQVYIQGVVDSIKGDCTLYDTLVEAVINAIQAIAETDRSDGEIKIHINRDQTALFGKEESIPHITSIVIEDNGIGFNDQNLEAFDTLYTPNKKASGGKGFGRFMYIYFFKNVSIESCYQDKQGKYKERTFDFGRTQDIVANPTSLSASEDSITGTRLTLETIIELKDEHKHNPDTDVFAHRVLEKILSYFIDDKKQPPKILIFDNTLSEEPLVLNALIGDAPKFLIQPKNQGDFKISTKRFNFKMFKNALPRQQTSHIHLVAHNRVVLSRPIHEYIPEFKKDFVEEIEIKDNKTKERKYVAQFYVHGEYLDKNVTTDRTGFNFGVEKDSLYPVGRQDVEERMAQIAKDIFSQEVKTRFSQKQAAIKAYALANPWFKPYYEKAKDKLNKLPIDPTEHEMELLLTEVKSTEDRKTEQAIKNLPTTSSAYSKSHKVAQKLAKVVTEVNQSNLTKYLAFRCHIIKLLKLSLGYQDNSKRPTEAELHKLIVPMGVSSDDNVEHNLWILDERFNFASFVASDKSVIKDTKLRPDVSIFNDLVAYREINEAHSPVNIFEFKRPGTHTFLQDKKDPFEKVIDYVMKIRANGVKTAKGTEFTVEKNTPFYAYIVADKDDAVGEWLHSKNAKILPAGQGWFYDHSNLNIHIEYITWKRLVDSAHIRHRKFFELLGIQHIDIS